ncbi:methyl-CpG binding domain protein 1 S homeolog isoform X10 [Xenopus laevis]|uniref:Methyl-CpG binding domain protein 1 S homeolog isoform X10 n=1 Tax=Xenopus laevis TaxID=8355 RepID=A0A8J0TNR0_XENLA|nr:methyl-CpG binding domain protein 1 S homeolog isoform X10 [Xenopus laevis]
MSEGWEDWPLLGPGWKRRISVRKSGASCGHIDIYYRSPTGEQMRSKIELAKYLGSSVDLSLFDFRNGVIVDKGHCSPKKKKGSQRKSLPADGTVTLPHKMPRLSLPMPALEESEQNGTAEKSVVRCHGCKVWFAGVEFGKSKINKWHCADCRASRRAFNKEQKVYKNAGCGTCDACKVTENCGHCTICLLRSHDPEFGSSWKCVRRRCLRVLRKSDDCGMCQGCCREDDCEGCSVCLDKMHNPDIDIKEKCLLRRCMNKKLVHCSPDYKNNDTKKLLIKKPTFIKQKKKKKTDRKGQEKNIPAFHRSSNNPVIIERMKQEAVAAEYEKVEVQQNQDTLLIVSPLRETFIKVEQINGQHCSSDERNSSHMKNETSRLIKEETAERDVPHTEEITPLDLNRSIKTEEFITETDDIEEADDSTPVIMEIFSLSSYHTTGDLDKVLQEFMGELNEMPLPAHWEVLAHTGPNLQLVQRSRLSTMADTVIYIQPGLLFHVIVKGHPVPSSHELYNNHPTRLTTVDDVVELICDLEAHQQCVGLLKPRHRSSECRVLVTCGGKCEECCKMPWLAGSNQ